MQVLAVSHTSGIAAACCQLHSAGFLTATVFDMSSSAISASAPPPYLYGFSVMPKISSPFMNPVRPPALTVALKSHATPFSVW